MMDKLNMRTQNLADENFKKLSEMFPNAVTETITGYDENGKAIIERAVDADVLRQEISASVVEGFEERYQFTWPDKKKSVVLANQPIAKTLRLDRERSVGKDGAPGSIDTENIYIEGDNLDALKLLQETYLGKVKMIYIDPPYNTGSDFIYENDFSMSADAWKSASGDYDDSGNRLRSNLESSGRFHTDWLNMMYPRLRLAKDLLSEDGVIFISIDDNEQENLKKICDEVFGAGNFVAQLVWERAYAPKNDARFISNSHDYVLMYVKNLSEFAIGRLPRTDEANARYANPDNDPRGVWKASDLSVKTYTESCDYPITAPSGRVIEPPAGRCWSLSKKAFLERLKDNRIWFGPDGNSVPSMKRFLTELKHDGLAPQSILFYKEVGHSQEGAQEVAKLLGGGYFNGPKPVRLLRRLLTLANTDPDSLILDFFSGSATTAHAVMQLNAEDGGKRKFIMVQLPEPCDEKSEAYKAGYRTICDIGEERIRRAGKKIADEIKKKNRQPSSTEEEKKVPDIGFRVFKVDTSNMKDVYYRPDDYDQNFIERLEDNIKEDRSPEDLLFQVMLDLGVPLSAAIKESEIAGKKVFDVADGYLIACFDTEITDATVTAIAKKQPFYAVFRDSSMASDSVLTNFEQIFATHSPKTVRRVL